MYSVFLGLLSGRAGPIWKPQAKTPEQHNTKTTRRKDDYRYHTSPSNHRLLAEPPWTPDVHSTRLVRVPADREPKALAKAPRVRSWLKGAHRPPFPIGYFWPETTLVGGWIFVAHFQRGIQEDLSLPVTYNKTSTLRKLRKAASTESR